MIPQRHRCESVFRVAVILLSFSLLSSCNTKTPDVRENLVRSLKGANVEGYHFATTEDDASVTASLTNGALQDIIKIDGSAANLVLRYTSIKDRKANTTSLYKAEIVKAGDSLTLLITDIATGKVISKDPFPAPEPRQGSDTTNCGATFNSLDACIKEFDCTRRGPLQCEANRTCQNQPVALKCCLDNGEVISVHFNVSPTTKRCVLRSLVPDIEGLVLSR